MAKIKFFNGNKGVWGYAQPESYDQTGMKTLASGATLVSFIYNETEFGASSDHPAKMKLFIKGATFDMTTGEITGGILTKATYLNAANKKVVEATKVNFDMADLAGVDEGAYFQTVFGGRNLFVGSDDSKADDWDGDVIITGTANDVVRANGGGDFISDEGGKDKYFGGEGTDTLSYAGHESAIVVKLAAGKITDGDGIVDRVDSIERVRGTQFKDKMTGDSENNRFAGLAGNDVLDGGAGTDDELRYDKDAQYGGEMGIIANMIKGKVRDGFGNTDTVKNFERVRGTDYDDKFFDNGGRDGYQGYDGDDLFVFKGGDDWADGGDGADTFVFKGAFGYDWIGDFDASEGDILKIAGAKKFADLTLDTSSKGNAQIKFGGHTVELDGVTEAEVDASFFIF